MSQPIAPTSGAKLLINQPTIPTAAPTPVASERRPVPAPRAIATAPVANPKNASCTASAVMCASVIPPPPTATPTISPIQVASAMISTTTAIAAALAAISRARRIGWASTSPMIRSSSSPAVVAEAPVIARAPITSGP